DTEMMARFTGGTDEGRAAVIDQEPIGRMGRPEEIAAAVLWLCSEEAAFTVGHAMVVDGGQTACADEPSGRAARRGARGDPRRVSADPDRRLDPDGGVAD